MDESLATPLRTGFAGWPLRRMFRDTLHEPVPKAVDRRFLYFSEPESPYCGGDDGKFNKKISGLSLLVGCPFLLASLLPTSENASRGMGRGGIN
jgi:hypothetical protein